MKYRTGLILILMLLPLLAQAIVPRQFDDAQIQARYENLLEGLRCLVCQNESLAESNADLAEDLRGEVYKLMREGSSDDEIRAYLTTRYGDFVLYRPPVRRSTYALWFGPLLILLFALAGVLLFIRRRRQLPPAAPLNEAERERLARLLEHSADSKE